MELILISLLLIFTFGFVGLITLGYIISLWEKQKLDIFSKTNKSNSDSSNNTNFGKLSKHSFSTVETNFNPKNMKISPKINEYFERSLVVVKNQDYKGWLDKTTIIIKKVSSNLELHFKFGLTKFMSLITKDKTNNSGIEPNISTTSNDVYKTIDKINKISQQDNGSLQQDNFNNNSNYLNSTLGNNSNDKDNFGQSNQPTDNSNYFVNAQGSIDVDHKTKSSFATLDLASEEAIKTQKSKDEVYEKIENSILDKLKIAGLSHYDIWLELGKHYEKYNEREKAIEIYSMVMKHSEGRNKDIARDGLIALS